MAGGPAAAPVGGGRGEVPGTAVARLAASAVRARLLGGRLPGEPPADSTLRQPGASFVTLERRGHLRGCIGTLQATRPLYTHVVRNAERAMADPRLPRVTADDWPELDVTVSVLSIPVDVPAAGRDDLVARLRPGVDGVIFGNDHERVTFLPTVWSTLPDPAQFVDALLAKGGWAADSWPAGMWVRRYTAVEFHDRAPRPRLQP